jgi:hypothetical protein
MHLDIQPIQLPGIWILLHKRHWYLVHLFTDKGGRMLANMFDSYANNPIEKYGLSIPNLYKCRHNTGVLQSDESLLCGVFCLYAAYFLSRGYSFMQIAKRFSRDRHRNEKKVVAFYARFGSVSSKDGMPMYCCCRAQNGL